MEFTFAIRLIRMLLNNNIKFHKMEGCGNDFVMIDKHQLQSVLTTDEIILMSDRNYGIGFDQLIVYESLKNNKVKVLIYNSDGSAAYSCGNGLRCLGLLMKNLYDKNELKITVEGGNITYTKVYSLKSAIEGNIYCELGQYTLEENDDGHLITVGNKHLVIEVDNIENADMGYGEYLSKKQNINVSFVEYLTSKAIVRVYERGVGETNACGSAAAAVYLANPCEKPEIEIIFQKSGEKIVAGTQLNAKNKQIAYIIGNAKIIYEGTFFK